MNRFLSGVAVATLCLGPAAAQDAFVLDDIVFSVGLTLGNINALAMEPMGHIAGLAASVISALATVAGVMLAIPLGLAFDGTARPIALGVAVLSALAWALLQTLPRRA